MTLIFSNHSPSISFSKITGLNGEENVNVISVFYSQQLEIGQATQQARRNAGDLVPVQHPGTERGICERETVMVWLRTTGN